MVHPSYRAEDAANLIIKPLDDLSLIYHRRSGTTHIVGSPVPEMLGAMGCDLLGVEEILERLSQQFELGDEAESLLAIVAARLEELAALGLVERR
jgi:PqqD family protein of HPr-rel-A system